ncbi:hypothetical protein BASA81_006461 [Batrachochytrium salamandrivorans]|nr:hypothetical protein BASA81_006461 [Batrachochytrium salamandrivorans]
MGETEEDCIKFLKRICQDQFDAAIFDQNLDYDNDIKGNELGCLILHSSDAQLAKLLESGVFHGTVEKSANSSLFIEGIAGFFWFGPQADDSDFVNKFQGCRSGKAQNHSPMRGE